MKGREGKGPPAAADFLVCFHSRAHLGLLPKPICSPARPPEPSSRHHLHHHHHHHLRPRQTSNRGGGPGGGHGSPLLWAKSKHNNADISEPASPKVTCAGQIKVIRPKPSSCKNWQSLMEEIERLHNNRKHGRRTLGFKRDLVQFLVCLRSIRFHCFGAENGSDNDEDDGEGGEGDLNSCGEDNRTAKGGCDDRNQGSEDVFSKWFMILQENNNLSRELIRGEDSRRVDVIRSCCDEGIVLDDDDGGGGGGGPSAPPPPPPPPNALLLMRCRSAPVKSWVEERSGIEVDDGKVKEKEKKGAEFTEFSCDFAEETWVSEGIRGKISRSRSWKR